jgi:predicted Zn-dependent protease
MLAIVFDKLGKKHLAEEELKKVLQKKPDHPEANNTLGYIWAEQGKNLEEAVRLIEKALAREPENGAFIDSLGWAYFMMGKYREALLKLKEASEREQDPVIFDHLGDAYLKLSNRKEAKKAYLKALELDPDMKTVMEKLEQLESN